MKTIIKIYEFCETSAD